MSKNVIKDNLYSRIHNLMKDKSKIEEFKKIVTDFIQKNYQKIYHHTPGYRIFFQEDDKNKLYKLVGMTESEVLSLIDSAFYFKIKNYNPRSMKDPTTVLILNLYRYCVINKVNRDIALTYLCFSPKVYLSIHVGQFPEFPPSESEKGMAVMDYTISTISNKFEIKKKGNLLEAIISIAKNWEDTYMSKITNWSDEDVCYIFQQLHNRIKQSLVTLSGEYYKNLESPKAILLYSSDNYSDDDFRISESNYMLIANYTNKTMNHILSSDANISICKAVSSDIPPLELKSLVETIVSNNDNLSKINLIITNIISNYYSSKDGNKSVTDIDFLNYSLTRKANSVNKEYNEMVSTVRNLLMTNSERYLKRRRRPSTEAAYVKSVIGYFVMVIHEANKGGR